jgi:hypothetical protein
MKELQRNLRCGRHHFRQPPPPLQNGRHFSFSRSCGRFGLSAAPGQIAIFDAPTFVLKQKNIKNAIYVFIAKLNRSIVK